MIFFANPEGIGQVFVYVRGQSSQEFDPKEEPCKSMEECVRLIIRCDLIEYLLVAELALSLVNLEFPYLRDAIGEMERNKEDVLYWRCIVDC